MPFVLAVSFGIARSVFATVLHFALPKVGGIVPIGIKAFLDTIGIITGTLIGRKGRAGKGD